MLKGVIDNIVAVLYEYRLELAAAFSLFDTDKDGVITRSEFLSAIHSLTLLSGSPISESQALELLHSLDVNGDGSISYEEFVHGFRLVEVNNQRVREGGGAPDRGRTPPRTPLKFH